MKDKENNQPTPPETEDQTPAYDYKEDLKDVDFFSLPHNEREQLKASIKEKMPEKEQRAMTAGWTLPEMDRGKNKDGTDRPWMDADTFLKKIETEAPVRNERMRKLSQENDSQKAEMQAMQKQMKTLTEINKAQMEREISQDEALNKRALAEAKELGDVEAFELATETKTGIDKQKLTLKSFEEPPTPSVIPNTPQVATEALDWAAANDWIVSDPKLMQHARLEDDLLKLKNPQMPLAERFALVTEKMRDEYPLQDSTPRQTYKSTKNSNTFGNQPKAKTTFNDLPEIDQKQATTLIKQGVYKDKADYLNSQRKMGLIT